MKFKYCVTHYWYYKILPRLIYRYDSTGDLKRETACYNYFKRHINWSHNNIGTTIPIKESVKPNDCIFIYWRQGFSNAPEIVKHCVSSIISHSGSHPVVLLDGTNINEYVEMPKYIKELHERGKIGEAHFSDLLRTDLLIRYGGYWCDATTFLSSSFPHYIESADFFMFNKPLSSNVKSPIECSNWFVRAKKHNLLLVRLRNLLYNYYKHFDSPFHYFVYHLGLSALVNNDNECRNVWLNKPYICNVVPHILSSHIKRNLPFVRVQYDMIIQSCFIHKLTYKYSKDILELKDSYLSEFKNNNPIIIK